MKNFKVSSLLQNLSHGPGSNIKLVKLPKSINIQIGQDKYGPPLSLLVVNELARLYHSNPDLIFNVSKSTESDIKIETDSNPISIELDECTNTIFDSIIKSLDSYLYQSVGQVVGG
jgi:hypothetical protein